MQIIPAVLVKTPEEFFEEIRKLQPYFKHFQIDIGDGKFVSNTTLQIEELFPHTEEMQSEMKDLVFDFHLMVNDYEKEIQKLGQLQKVITIKNILIHAPYFPNTITNNIFTFGPVLNPEDSVSDLAKKNNLHTIPFIQIMTVHPGFQGASFIPESLQKIEQLRTLDYRNKISIDGAVNEKTIPLILSQKHKPDVLCVGSYLSKAENVEERTKKLLTFDF